MTDVKQYDFTETEVSKLFQMQDTLNSYIHPEWKTQGFNWDLAIVDECMEIHGHLGWKWWRPGYQQGLTPANIKQVQLEVIDILHFAISGELEVDSTPDFHYWVTNFNYPVRMGETLQTWLKYCKVQAADENFDMADWVDLAHLVELTKSQILETYTQKYVLNKFRQDNGYKTGEYKKNWVLCTDIGPCGDVHTGGEDNYWLEQVVTKLRQGGHDTTDEILLYNELALLYNSRLNKS